MGSLLMIIVLLYILASPFAIYALVPGKRSTKLQAIGWLELLIVYLCLILPIRLIFGIGDHGKVIDIIKFPELFPLSIIDLLLGIVLFSMSIFVGVCLWKTSKGAVKKAKIFLIALLIYQIVVVRGIYNFIFFAELSNANINIPARAVLDAFTKDIMGTIVTAVILGACYIYLNRSQRVKEIFNTSPEASSAEI